MTIRQELKSSLGFTLIEIMLAVTILGVILAMLAGSFNAVAHSKTRFESELYVDHEGRALLWAISSELRDAVQTTLFPSHVLLLGRGQIRNGRPMDSITISTFDLSHTPSFDGFGAELNVIYSFQPNQDHRGWYLLTRAAQSGLLTRPGAPQAVTIADNLLSLHIRYFDGNNWDESWDSSTLPSGHQLPLAVSIDLSIAGDHGRPADFATQVSLPMAFVDW
jgi:prepilin-type N-terminal cleavage/methylation domain-containing protein